MGYNVNVPRDRNYTPMGKQVIITVTMPPNLALLLDEAADRRGLTRSAYMRLAVEAQVQRDAEAEDGA